ncbi:rRNA maturation RNase YbeY [Patescibacteria group bacterium]|nr:rRNA maturation RNase YbeY [Patescibacteria group bacterium]
MIILEINNQTKFRAPKKQLNDLLSLAQKLLKINKKQLISLALVSDYQIKKLNRIYRKKDKATDVLSFCGEPSAELPEEPLGEIIISPSRAKRQAENGLTDELARLALHGYLHLLGYDHEKETEAEKMEALEKKILKLFYD